MEGRMCEMAWKTVRADEFCSFVTDGTHDSPKPQSQGRKLITSKHLKGDYIDFDSANWISEGDYQKIIARSAVEQWDILFSMIGTIGTIYLEKNPIVEYACKNMGVFKFAGNAENAFWMYYYLKSPQAKGYIQSHLRGSTQAYVPLGSLREMPVSIPDRETRNRIVSLLKPLDEKIAINRAINDNLQQQAMALYAEMFLNSSDNNVTSGTLSDIAVITMGQSPSGSSYNEDGVGEVFYQGRAEFGFRFPKRRLFTTEPKRMAETGDVLLSVRAPVGDLNIAYERCCIGRGLGAIHSKTGHSSFVLYTMFALRSQLDIFNGEGTVFGSINRDALNAIPIDIPPVTEIDQFEVVAHPIDELIRANYEENCRLEAIRDSLLPKLMSGEIDISAVQL